MIDNAATNSLISIAIDSMATDVMEVLRTNYLVQFLLVLFFVLSIVLLIAAMDAILHVVIANAVGGTLQPYDNDDYNELTIEQTYWEQKANSTEDDEMRRLYGMRAKSTERKRVAALRMVK